MMSHKKSERVELRNNPATLAISV